MSVDTAACGAPQLTILAFGAPVILLVAGVWAFVRTYRVWRDHGIWWAWQGAGWLLMVLMFVTLTMGAPIAGPFWLVEARTSGCLLVAVSGYLLVTSRGAFDHEELAGGWSARHPITGDKITNAMT